MSCFDPHRKYPAACPHAVGLNASSTGTRLLSLSTIADAKSAIRPGSIFNRQGGDADKNLDWLCREAQAFTILNGTERAEGNLDSFFVVPANV